MARYVELTYPKARERWVRILKQELSRNRTESKATLKDIGIVFDDYISRQGYDLTKQTKLYVKHGGEYCSLLEMLNYLDKEGKFDEVYELRRVKSITTVYGVFYQDSETFNNGIILFKVESEALQCFSRLFTIGKQKGKVLYNTDINFKKKYDAEIKLACNKSLHIYDNINIKDIQGEEVKFLYEGKRISLVSPLKTVI